MEHRTENRLWKGQSRHSNPKEDLHQKIFDPHEKVIKLDRHCNFSDYYKTSEILFLTYCIFYKKYYKHWSTNFWNIKLD